MVGWDERLWWGCMGLGGAVEQQQQPREDGGRSPGAVRLHTLASGKRRENGPTKILCSYANVGSTMYSTGAPSSLMRLMHSCVMTGDGARDV